MRRRGFLPIGITISEILAKCRPSSSMFFSFLPKLLFIANFCFRALKKKLISEGYGMVGEEDKKSLRFLEIWESHVEQCVFPSLLSFFSLFSSLLSFFSCAFSKPSDDLWSSVGNFVGCA